MKIFCLNSKTLAPPYTSSDSSPYIFDVINNAVICSSANVFKETGDTYSAK